jgi:Zn-dependent protease
MFTISDLIYVIPALIISLGIHEATHAYTAHALGDNTALNAGRLTLNPLKHINLYATIILPVITIALFGFPMLIAKPVPFNPYKVKFGEYGAALVGISGPLINLVMAIITAIFLRFLTFPFDIEKFLLIFTELNVISFIINMIPIPPLDGSRLLYALAPRELQKIMNRIESFGYLAILAIFLLVFNFIYAPIDYCYVHLMNVLLG